MIRNNGESTGKSKREMTCAPGLTGSFWGLGSPEIRESFSGGRLRFENKYIGPYVILGFP